MKENPQDYYFVFDNYIPNETRFIFALRKEWDESGIRVDFLKYSNILPSKFHCVGINEYEYQGDPQVGRRLLIYSGFKEK